MNGVGRVGVKSRRAERKKEKARDGEFRFITTFATRTNAANGVWTLVD